MLSVIQIQPKSLIPMAKKSQKSSENSPDGRRASTLLSVRKRGAVNRAVRRENLREEMRAREYLRQLQEIDDELGSINTDVKKLKIGTTKTTEQYAAAKNLAEFELSKHDVRIKALKVKAELNFKRLNKVLPDLKSVELSDPDGKNPFTSFVDEVRKLTKGAYDVES